MLLNRITETYQRIAGGAMSWDSIILAQNQRRARMAVAWNWS
jgi:hypothetical protein